MAKKSKSRQGAGNNPVSVGAVRASRAVDAVTPDFVRWCESDPNFPAGAELELLEPIKDVVELYFMQVPAAVATYFEPVPFATAMNALLQALDDEDATFVFDALHFYLGFLSETNAWTGSDEDFALIDEIFHDDAGIPGIVVPELDPGVELEALAATGLARRAEALLRWLGTGKQVTATGALRLKDIEPAGAAIGVAVTGALPSKRVQEPLFGQPETAPESLRSIKTMRDEPRLAMFWAAAQAAGLINIDGTRALPGQAAEDFLGEASPQKLGILRVLATEYIHLSVVGEIQWNPWMIDVATAQATILVAATTGTPPGFDLLESLTEEGAQHLVGLDSISGGHIIARLENLAELGLLTIDSHISVPPAVVACVSAALADQDMFDGPEFDLDVAAGPIMPERAPARRKTPAAKPSVVEPQFLQLKVSLKRASPPIWRRLLVRSDLTLEQLHVIVQKSFDWLGYHLHGFRFGGYPGIEYGPAGDNGGFGDPPIDEADIAIGEVLTAEKDTITYTYDFGDDWEHAITVEKVLPNDPKAPAVRCTGGRGAGPAEDSGGVWGWAAIVDAVNDPTHEEHEEYRDWLGLAPGAKFDPKYFDKEMVNDELAVLF